MGKAEREFMQFGDIPEEVLAIELHEFEGKYKTLAHMIVESVNEDIERAKYVATTTNDPERPLTLSSFIAWTANYVLTLIFTPLGYYMVVSDRDY